MSITHAKVAADPEVPLLNDADWNADHVGAPTLAEVLAAGNDVGEVAIVSTADGGIGAGAALGLVAAVDATAGYAYLNGGDASVDGKNGGSVDVFSGGLYGATDAVDGATSGYTGATSSQAGGLSLRSGGFYTAPASNDGAHVVIRGADATNPGLVFLNLPTSDPAVAGALWSNAGVVMVSSG